MIANHLYFCRYFNFFILNRPHPKLLFFLLTNLLFVAIKATCQDFSDAFFKENLLKTSYSIDTSAAAIVLYERGEDNIVERGYHEYSRYDCIRHVHEIIKILKPEAVGIAYRSFTYRNVTDMYEGYVNNIAATTYNISGGSIIKTALNKDSIIEKPLEKYHNKAILFTIPDVKVGSIIDYEYDVSNNINYSLASWSFQGKYPKLVSEFQLTSIPGFSYNSIIQGQLNFEDCEDERDIEKKNPHAYKVIFPRLVDKKYRVLWGEKNINAIKEEPYSCGTENIKQLLELQISYSTAGYRDDNRDILDEWEKADKIKKESDFFGRRIKMNNIFLNKFIDSLTWYCKSPTEKAKIIFSFMKSNFTCTDYGEIFILKNLKDVFEDRKGNIAEINGLLTAMLLKAGLESSPVLLSTRDNPRLSPTYPILDRINYIASSVKLNDSLYLLDASLKYNSFGILPEYCYNGYARILGQKGSGIMLTPRQLKDKNVYYLNVTGFNDTSVYIDVNIKKGKINSFEWRGMAFGEKDSSRIDSMLAISARDRKKDFGSNAIISDYSVENLNDADTNLIIRYKLRIKLDAGKHKQALITDITKLFKSNPFISPKRTTPIELPCLVDDAYILTMQVPANIQIGELPQNVNIKCANGALIFKHNTSFDSSSRMLTVHSNFTANEAIFSVDQYDNIREFFDEMIKAEDSEIKFDIL